jgi:hypothetical protein
LTQTEVVIAEIFNPTMRAGLRLTSHIDRAEHLAWCKRRALEYVERGDLTHAVASMMSDLNKHQETADMGSFFGLLGIQYASTRDACAVRDWIKGFP